jgi:biotin carboxyl carrier protein
MKNLRVTIDGKTFNVSVELLDEPASLTSAKAPVAAVVAPVVPAAPAAAPAPAAAVQAPAGPGEVRSPLHGKIVSIDVTVGQAVEEGTKVVTLEAMKMNTYVFAPKAGKVISIAAAAGTAVEEGGLLLVIG